MLKKDQITKIATTLRITETDLINALTSTEEIELTIPELNVLSTEDLTLRDANSKKVGYTEGKTAGLEMWVKDTKEKHGLEFEGKEPEKLIEALTSKVLKEAKIEPSKQVEELNKVVANLQKNVSAFESEKQSLLSQIEATKTDAQLLSYLPKERISSMNDNEYLTIIKSALEITTEDGKQVVKKGGEIVRNPTTQAPLEISEVINSYFTERKWIAEGQEGKQGRGGSGSAGAGGVPLKLSELQKSFEAQGKSMQGSEFMAAVQEAVSKNPNFDMNA